LLKLPSLATCHAAMICGRTIAKDGRSIVAKAKLAASL